jgi:hypothetical protein
MRGRVGKRPNYGFEKRQKEVKKQQKKDEKAEKKRARREEAAEQESSSEGGAETDEESDQPAARRGAAGLEVALDAADLDPELAARVSALCEAGWDLWARFDTRVRQREFHPFVAADYQVVLEALLPLRAPGLKFLEWGSAMGVITIMADLLGFEAYGIELDRELVDEARELARTTGSGARFVAGSFLPAGYQWKDGGGDDRLGTIGQGESGYLQLGMPLEEFDIVFGYPWSGEEAMMIDLMRVHGRRDARFLLHSEGKIRVYRGGRVWT